MIVVDRDRTDLERSVRPYQALAPFPYLLLLQAEASAEFLQVRQHSRVKPKPEAENLDSFLKLNLFLQQYLLRGVIAHRLANTYRYPYPISQETTSAEIDPDWEKAYETFLDSLDLLLHNQYRETAQPTDSFLDQLPLDQAVSYFEFQVYWLLSEKDPNKKTALDFYHGIPFHITERALHNIQDYLNTKKVKAETEKVVKVKKEPAEEILVPEV